MTPRSAPLPATFAELVRRARVENVLRRSRHRRPLKRKENR